MNNNINYKKQILEIQRVINNITPIVNTTESFDNVAKVLSSSFINSKLLDEMKNITGFDESISKIVNNNSIKDIMGLASIMSETSKKFSLVQTNNHVHDLLQSLSIKININNSIKDLSLVIDSGLTNAIQSLKIDMFGLQKVIQSNLQVFRDIDWAEIVDSEDLEDFDIRNILDDGNIDISDGISFQQQIAELANKIKNKYPIIFFLLIWLILDPIKSAISHEVLNLVKGTTTKTIVQTETYDYKSVERSIKIEVNNKLNLNIESKNIKDDILKTYGYVSKNNLIMRENNRVKSRAIYTLNFGHVIKIIHKNRNWTLIEYENEEDIIQGWVFTRYISKFKR